MDSEKPKWNHDIPIGQFETLINNCITKVTHHWRMTGTDTSEDWVELHYGDKKSMRMPQGFDLYFKFEPNYRELFRLTTFAQSAIRNLEEVRKWEKKNKRELAQYERLKAKFG